MDELTHFGVKGMRWGVRKNSYGVSRSTNREARKDAKEFARAKMYYGEGAGTRRKLIKATVEAKAKRDPSYKKAFDTHLDNQDMSKRAAEARSKRRRTDVSNTTKKTTRGVIRMLSDPTATGSALAITVVAGYGMAKKSGYDKVVAESAKKLYSLAVREVKTQKIKRTFQNFM